MAVFTFIVSVLFAYLLGSVSFSYIAGKMVAGVDIRQHGSGNAGATNTLRVIGVKWGLIVLLADVVKGVLAVAFAHLITGGSLVAMTFAGLFSIVGHNWPIYYGFRGGKGIATTIGVLFTLSFMPALYAGLVGLVLIVLTRYVSLGSLVFVTLTPIFAIAMRLPWYVIVIAFVIAIMSFWRHRSNIERLLHGQERKVFQR